MESENTKNETKVSRSTTTTETKTPNKLLERVNKTKLDASEYSKSALTLANTETPPEQSSQSQEQIELALKTLIESQDPDSDFLTTSSQVLANTEEFIKNTVQEQSSLEQQTNKPYFRKMELEEKQKELTKAKGVKKIIAFFQRGQNQKQINKDQSVIDNLSSQIQQKRDLIDNLSNKKTELQKKRNEALLTEIGSNIGKIKDTYEELYKEIVGDKETMTQIRQEYIDTAIAPVLEKVAKEKGYPDTKKQELYTAINEYITHRDEPEESKKTYRQKVENLLTYDNGFYDAGDRVRSLIDGADKKIVQHLVVKMAKQEIEKVKNEFSPMFTGYDAQEKFKSMFEHAIHPDRRFHYEENTFGGRLLSEFNPYATSNYPNIEMWFSFKKSHKAVEILGQEIFQEDQRIYQSALENSLSDSEGQHIDLLYYYPTPDAIRNLVVLAAADNYAYRQVHANTTLDNLAKNTNWKQILDDAQSKYVGIQKLRTDLENWHHREYYIHPTVRQNASELAETIYAQEGSIDPRLTELSARALSNLAINKILEKRGAVTESEAKIINQALSTLSDMSLESWNHRMEENYKGRYVSDYAFQSASREVLFSLLMTDTEKINASQKELVRRFAELSKMIIDKKDDDKALAYLTDNLVITKLKDTTLLPQDATRLLTAYEQLPELVSNSQLLQKFCEQFKDQETIQFFIDATKAYSANKKELISILALLEEQKLTKESVLDLPIRASDILASSNFSVAAEFPQLYLETSQNNEYFRKMEKNYSGDYDLFAEASRAVVYNNLSPELALLFPEQAPFFLAKSMKETRAYIFQNSTTLLKDASDIKFLNSIVGEFGKKSDQLIRGYGACLKDEALTTNDKDLVLEFVRQFRVISPMTLKGYKEAKAGGYEKVYIAKLQSLAEKLTGSTPVTEEERQSQYYKDLLIHVYSNNSGHWASLQGNESCADRTNDLSEFKIRPIYQIDLLTQSEIRVKVGQTLNQTVKESVQEPILNVANKISELGNDSEKIKLNLEQNLDSMITQISENGGFVDIDISSVKTTEEKLFLVLTDSIYGTRTIAEDLLKNTIIMYDFANFENINDYINGTTDRVGRANNQDYALLCEVNAFYSDRIKDVNKKIVTDAFGSPEIQKLMPSYFQKLSQDTALIARRDAINRLQVDKLGLTDNFVKQMGNILQKRNGRPYSADEVKNIIRRYERMTKGLSEKSTSSKKQGTRAFYGQIRSQREKIFSALGVITGKEIDPSETYLGEIDLHQALASEANIREGNYDETQFASYTAQRFIDIFEQERSSIHEELDKFESISGKKREVLNGYIAKTKESANARMVGGVCVSGDNPNKNPDKNLWDMPNYLQMVFQEPDTLQCQGVVLMHHFNDNGKKVLTASINPSSTYVYSVDESALLNGIIDSLEIFAQENQFDILTISSHKNIRTNRTGGEFERAMDARISKVGKKFVFSEEKQFSFSPDYRLKEMDIIWEKK